MTPPFRFGVFARLVTIMGGIAVGSTTLALVLQDRTLSADLLAAASERMASVASAADRIMGDHLDDVVERYAAVSRTPEFRANLEAGDRATLTYYAERLLERQGAAGVAFRSLDSEVAAVAGDVRLVRRAVDEAHPGEPDWLRTEDGLFATVAIPLHTGEALAGHLVAVDPVGPGVLAYWSEVLGVRVSPAWDTTEGSDVLRAAPPTHARAGLELSSTYEPERRAIARARRNLALAGLAGTLLAILAGIVFSHSFTRPIRELKRAVDRVDLESLDAPFEVRRNDELGDLGRAFLDMLGRLHESEVRLARAQRLARFSSWSFDLESDLVQAGRDFRRLFDLDAKADLRIDDLVRRIHPDDRARFIEDLERARESRGAFRSDVRIPIRQGEDRVLHLRGQRRSSADGVSRVEASAQDVSERWHSARQVEYLSLHDSVTGLGNRQYLQERFLVQLKRAAHDDTTLAVFVLALDGFAAVEGTMGHRVGDELLCEVARRIMARLAVPRRHDRRRRRSPDAYTAVRFGQDEFVAVDVVTSREEAAALAESLVAAVEEMYVVDGQEILLGATVGVSLFPDDSTSADELLQDGKSALQTARAASQRYRFYEEAMHERQSRRMGVASRLRRAIEREELEMYYQPRVWPECGTLVGVEALVRWRDESLGVVSPAEFIPIAEEVGLVRDLGDWCLRKSMADLRRWRSMGVTDLRVSVNVSPKQLSRSFVDRVRETTAELDPGTVEFEVTETAVIRNPNEAIGLLRALAESGYRISLDDFGTGYSSMSHVHQMPLHAVKIDRSFIRGLARRAGARSITEAVVRMCQAMQLEAVAEGVETEPQRRRLVELGCDEAQGFLFGRPMSAASLEEVMRARKLMTEPETAV